MHRKVFDAEIDDLHRNPGVGYLRKVAVGHLKEAHKRVVSFEVHHKRVVSFGVHHKKVVVSCMIEIDLGFGNRSVVMGGCRVYELLRWVDKRSVVLSQYSLLVGLRKMNSHIRLPAKTLDVLHVPETFHPNCPSSPSYAVDCSESSNNSAAVLASFRHSQADLPKHLQVQSSRCSTDFDYGNHSETGLLKLPNHHHHYHSGYWASFHLPAADSSHIAQSPPRGFGLSYTVPAFHRDALCFDSHLGLSQYPTPAVQACHKDVPGLPAE